MVCGDHFSSVQEKIEIEYPRPEPSTGSDTACRPLGVLKV